MANVSRCTCFFSSAPASETVLNTDMEAKSPFEAESIESDMIKHQAMKYKLHKNMPNNHIPLWML